MKGAKGEARVRVPESRLGMASTSRRKSIPYGRYSALSACRAFLVALLAILPLCSAYATTYTYDAAGRLKSATNSQGQTAVYDYDSRGNLLRIERTDSTQLAIASFTPNNGPPGIQVTINGSGFSSTTSGDTVAFNGISAPVLSASPTQLLVQVPQNATTGPITVTAVSTTVTSDDIFTVSTIGDPPIISGFTPAAGTTVTITGQHLDPIDGDTTITIAGVFVPITSIDDLSISFEVPPWVGSGPITVTTPYGVATTTSLLVVPIGTDPATVTLEPPLSEGGAAQSVSLSDTKPTDVYVFQASIGDFVSLQASGFSNPNSSASYVVYSPFGTPFASGNISASTPTVHLPPLLATGSYSLYLGGGSSAPQFSIALERDTAIMENAASAVTSTTQPASSRRITFYAVAGENLGLGISNLVTNDGNGIAVYIYPPNSTSLWQQQGCAVPQCSFNLFNIPVSGTYTVVFVPQSSQTFSATVTISDAATATLMVGVPQTLSMSRFGQTGLYSFSGTSGQQINLQFSTPTGSPLAGIEVLNPDGSDLVGWDWVNSTNLYNRTLTQTGTYSIRVWINGGSPGRILGVLGTPISDPAPLAFDSNNAASLVSFSNTNQTIALSATVGGNGYVSAFGNCGVTSGKWIYRVHVDSASQDLGVGVAGSGAPVAGEFVQQSNGYGATASGYSVSGNTGVSDDAPYHAGSTVDVAFDANNGNLWIAADGTWIGGGDPASGTSPLYYGVPAGAYLPAIFAQQSGDGFTIQTPPAVAGFSTWPGTCKSANFIDAAGHSPVAHGGALVSNLNRRFGSPASGSGDPSSALVKLLLHFEQSTASASSGSFVASNSSYLTIPSSADFDLTSGDWTIEAFVYPTALSSGSSEIVSKDGQAWFSYPQYDLQISSSGHLIGLIGTGTGTGGIQNITSTDAVPLYTWSHVVFQRSGNTISLYLNGALEVSANVSVAMTARSQPLYVGYQQDQDSNSFFNGYIDELRITKGLARYPGGSYAVPVAAFPGP